MEEVLLVCMDLEVLVKVDRVEVRHMLLVLLLLMVAEEQRIKDIEGEILPNLL